MAEMFQFLFQALPKIGMNVLRGESARKEDTCKSGYNNL
jgi:hypothetical protein